MCIYPELKKQSLQAQLIHGKLCIVSSLGLILLYLVLQDLISALLGSIFALCVYFFGLIRTDHHIDGISFDSIHAILVAHKNVDGVMFVASVTFAAIVIISVIRVYWSEYWGRDDPTGFGLSPPVDNYVYVAAFLSAILVVLINAPLTHYLSNGRNGNQSVSMVALNVSVGVRIIIALSAIFIVPFVEELLFRGVLMSVLSRYLCSTIVVITSAMLFALTHLIDFKIPSFYVIPGLFISGIVLGWFRVRTKSLFPSIVIHSTLNAFSVIGWFVVIHHPA